MSATREVTTGALLAQRSVIVEFGRIALQSESLDEILTKACECCAEALETDLSKVLRLEDDGQHLRVVAGIGWEDGIVGEEVVPRPETSSEGFALYHGKPAVSSKLEEDGFDYPAFLKRHGVKSMVNVIIPGSEGAPPFGLLEVDSREEREFTQSDVEFLQGYANIVGAAIERFSKSDALRRAVQERERALGELQHRVRNNLSVLQSLIRTRNTRTDHPEVRNETALILGQIETLVQLHELLTSSSDIDEIELGGFLSALCSQIASFGSDRTTRCDLRTRIESIVVESGAAIPLGIIANEFMTNSLKHAVRENRCDVFLSVVNGEEGVEVELSDGGDGLGDALDQPRTSGRASGLSYIEALIRQIGAEGSWNSEGGTTLRILLPHERRRGAGG
ncbi:sensor histidine kinase [Histidinibacterium lentulum]|uniref:histidine kinase n=1 Tax=Histidinibacterium lentulum TaxID=2480588 RepID=A0A3N2R932_9RHOB|nr:histidine kinase dimerization/phosphoacceptor domain -containing protein [Histidinibacterium lentulum]ROU03945.1 GAF domain-containing protein [Histidinibacterium lentulum]